MTFLSQKQVQESQLETLRSLQKSILELNEKRKNSADFDSLLECLGKVISFHEFLSTTLKEDTQFSKYLEDLFAKSGLFVVCIYWMYYSIGIEDLSGCLESDENTEQLGQKAFDRFKQSFQYVLSLNQLWDQKRGPSELALDQLGTLAAEITMKQIKPMFPEEQEERFLQDYELGTQSRLVHSGYLVELVRDTLPSLLTRKKYYLFSDSRLIECDIENTKLRVSRYWDMKLFTAEESDWVNERFSLDIFVLRGDEDEVEFVAPSDVFAHIWIQRLKTAKKKLKSIEVYSNRSSIQNEVISFSTKQASGIDMSVFSSDTEDSTLKQRSDERRKSSVNPQDVLESLIEVDEMKELEKLFVGQVQLRQEGTHRTVLMSGELSKRHKYATSRFTKYYFHLLGDILVQSIPVDKVTGKLFKLKKIIPLHDYMIGEEFTLPNIVLQHKHNSSKIVLKCDSLKRKENWMDRLHLAAKTIDLDSSDVTALHLKAVIAFEQEVVHLLEAVVNRWVLRVEDDVFDVADTTMESYGLLQDRYLAAIFFQLKLFLSLHKEILEALETAFKESELTFFKESSFSQLFLQFKRLWNMYVHYNGIIDFAVHRFVWYLERDEDNILDKFTCEFLSSMTNRAFVTTESIDLLQILKGCLQLGNYQNLLSVLQSENAGSKHKALGLFSTISDEMSLRRESEKELRGTEDARAAFFSRVAKEPVSIHGLALLVDEVGIVMGDHEVAVLGSQLVVFKISNQKVKKLREWDLRKCSASNLSDERDVMLRLQFEDEERPIGNRKVHVDILCGSYSEKDRWFKVISNWKRRVRSTVFQSMDQLVSSFNSEYNLDNEERKLVDSAEIRLNGEKATIVLFSDTILVAREQRTGQFIPLMLLLLCEANALRDFDRADAVCVQVGGEELRFVFSDQSNREKWQLLIEQGIRDSPAFSDLEIHDSLVPFIIPECGDQGLAPFVNRRGSILSSRKGSSLSDLSDKPFSPNHPAIDIMMFLHQWTKSIVKNNAKLALSKPLSNNEEIPAIRFVKDTDTLGEGKIELPPRASQESNSSSGVRKVRFQPSGGGKESTVVYERDPNAPLVPPLIGFFNKNLTFHLHRELA